MVEISKRLKVNLYSQGLKSLVTPTSQNMLERRCDESQRRSYARKIPHVYVL